MVTLHATCVVVQDLAVLLRGPSGSGKSDLALRLIDGGARLIADDQVRLRVEPPPPHSDIPSGKAGLVARLVASCPAAIAGLMEVRGVGILPVPHQPEGAVALIVDLIDEAVDTQQPRSVPERLPCPEFATILSVTVPRLQLNPFEASAAARLRLAVQALRSGQLGKVPAPAHLSDKAFALAMGAGPAGQPGQPGQPHDHGTPPFSNRASTQPK